MQIAFAEYTLAFKEWLDEAEFAQYMTPVAATHILLGCDLCDAKKYHSAVVTDAKRPDYRLVVKVRSEGHGLEPGVLPIPEQGLLIFGFISEIVAVKVREQRIAFSHRLPFFFYSFRWLMSLGSVLVLHELGVVALDTSGAKLWEYDGQDVLTGSRLDDDWLMLRFMDGGSVAIDVRSGATAQGASLRQTELNSGKKHRASAS